MPCIKRRGTKKAIVISSFGQEVRAVEAGLDAPDISIGIVAFCREEPVNISFINSGVQADAITRLKFHSQ